MCGIDIPNGRPKPSGERRDTQDLPFIQPVVQDSAENETEDPISEIDEILEYWTDRQHQIAEREAQAQAESKRFLEEFKELSEHVIKPAMEQIIQRLRKDGGGGLIWEGGSTTTHEAKRLSSNSKMLAGWTGLEPSWRQQRKSLAERALSCL